MLYSTLSPCDMCSGTALLYRIPRIVIGENQTFRGPEDYVRSRGVEVEVVQDPDCIRLMTEFIRDRPELWNEDIGDLNPPERVTLFSRPAAQIGYVERPSRIDPVSTVEESAGWTTWTGRCYGCASR